MTGNLFRLLAVTALALPSVAGAAEPSRTGTAAYPVKPIRIVSPLAAGGRPTR